MLEAASTPLRRRDMEKLGHIALQGLTASELLAGEIQQR